MNRMDGPAKLMVLPDPINNPVPIAPPIAINCKCRLDKLRCSPPFSLDGSRNSFDIVIFNSQFLCHKISLKTLTIEKVFADFLQIFKISGFLVAFSLNFPLLYI